MNRQVEYYYPEDVMEILQCKKTTAYNFIRKLNKELREQGIFTMAGRVPKAYFDDHVIYSGGTKQ